jgi:hypothetical protein
MNIFINRFTYFVDSTKKVTYFVDFSKKVSSPKYFYKNKKFSEFGIFFFFLFLFLKYFGLFKNEYFYKPIYLFC